MTTRSGSVRATAPAAGSKRSSQHISEIAEQDAKRVCNPDFNTPFQSIDDAVERLLPYHILGSEDPGEADVREAEESGTSLAVTRWDAWQGYATKKANDLERNRWHINEKINAIEKADFDKSEMVRLALHTYAEAEAERDLQAETRRRQAAAQAAIEAHKKAQAEFLQRQMLAAQQAKLQAQAAMQARQLQAAQAAQQAQEAEAAQAALEKAQNAGNASAQPSEAGAAGTTTAPAVAPASTAAPAAAAAGAGATAAPDAAAAAPAAPPQKKEDARSKLLKLAKKGFK